MIIDSIENFGRYANLHPNFAKAVCFLEQNDPFSLPDGKTIVDGENVFINVGDNFISQHETSWEAHAKYADVQLILQGKERFFWSDKAKREKLDLSKDFQVCRADPLVDFVLGKGQFVIFLPYEPHSPANPAGAPAVCRKAVIKVLCG